MPSSTEEMACPILVIIRIQMTLLRPHWLLYNVHNSPVYNNTLHYLPIHFQVVSAFLTNWVLLSIPKNQMQHKINLLYDLQYKNNSYFVYHTTYFVDNPH